MNGELVMSRFKKFILSYLVDLLDCQRACRLTLGKEWIRLWKVWIQNLCRILRLMNLTIFGEHDFSHLEILFMFWLVLLVLLSTSI